MRSSSLLKDESGRLVWFRMLPGVKGGLDGGGLGGGGLGGGGLGGGGLGGAGLGGGGLGQVAIAQQCSRQPRVAISTGFQEGQPAAHCAQRLVHSQVVSK
eukprot:1173929-Prorocentrum_minimum.AAC.1